MKHQNKSSQQSFQKKSKVAGAQEVLTNAVGEVVESRGTLVAAWAPVLGLAQALARLVAAHLLRSARRVARTHCTDTGHAPLSGHAIFLKVY